MYNSIVRRGTLFRILYKNLDLFICSISQCMNQVHEDVLKVLSLILRGFQGYFAAFIFRRVKNTLGL